MCIKTKDNTLICVNLHICQLLSSKHQQDGVTAVQNPPNPSPATDSFWSVLGMICMQLDAWFLVLFVCSQLPETCGPRQFSFQLFWCSSQNPSAGSWAESAELSQRGWMASIACWDARRIWNLDPREAMLRCRLWGDRSSGAVVTDASPIMRATGHYLAIFRQAEKLV